MFRQIGPLEIVLILSVLLLLFGAKRLPELGKSVGKSLREFKGATKGLIDDEDEAKAVDKDSEDAKASASEAAVPTQSRAKDAGE